MTGFQAHVTFLQGSCKVHLEFERKLLEAPADHVCCPSGEVSQLAAHLEAAAAAPGLLASPVPMSSVCAAAWHNKYCQAHVPYIKQHTPTHSILVCCHHNMIYEVMP